MPFFTIVIPVYNRADLLPFTLNSVLDQAYTDFEAVVVDDGSTDATPQRVHDLARRDSRIRYIHQENAERGRARNNGIRQANGRYVVLFDSDDLMHPDHLLTLHAHILRLGEPDFIAAKFDFALDGHRRPSDIMQLSEGYYDYRLLLRGNPLACNFSFRNNLTGMHPFEEDPQYAMLEDWMFLLQNLETFRLYLIDQVTVSLRDHDDRSVKNNALMVRKAAWTLEWMRTHLRLKPEEWNRLEAQVYYLSAIHTYLDGKRRATIELLTRAMRCDGWRNAYATLLLKTLAGRSLVLKLKR